MNFGAIFGRNDFGKWPKPVSPLTWLLLAEMAAALALIVVNIIHLIGG